MLGPVKQAKTQAVERARPRERKKRHEIREPNKGLLHLWWVSEGAKRLELRSLSCGYLVGTVNLIDGRLDLRRAGRSGSGRGRR